MASLLEDKLFQINGQGPAPSKDFFRLVITKEQVIWTTWKISLRLECKGCPPKELKAPHEVFINDKMLQSEIGAVFGQKIVDYAISLCLGNFDYLERLPDDILLKIMSYLELKHITQLAQVSHRFEKITKSEKFWEQHVRNCCEEYTDDMENLANIIGWRTTFFTFFNKTTSKKE